ncbi:DegT/DnrJ/EryC1/StrS family aminotransferase [Rhodococcus rhodochrous]|uniref:DegT/DnrJ/EryC1/StrS family aminotransferase n=1 Tax=Rhodococcus rhodochrous TaxID=1829 RepID=UPI001AF85D42|nr:aminotransferase class I/II-fold pyridoxal phosphate-dependent enzyme [Rhodococcus rhodochrous]QOH58094.1 pyridoxal-5'-phosphate-dependent protein [Rhodococcus rhodochrous]
MTERILMSSPDVGELEEKALLEAFRSGWIAPLGPHVDAFEARVAERVGRDFAVALSSGTAALHLALLTNAIGVGDVVMCSTMTFAATANAIMYTGARPVFVDVDETGNMNPEILREAVTCELSRGSSVAAIVPVDLLGKIADYESIEAVAQEYEIPVIADAAESFGAWRCGRPAGSFGDHAIVSFNGNKIMTTSGGGMLLTDSEDVASRARYLATQARKPVVHYEHEDVGFNYRLSNLLAGLGLAQLDRLDEMIGRRVALRRRYREFFQGVEGVEVFGGDDGATPGPGAAAGTKDNCWLTSIYVEPTSAGWCARDLMNFLDSENVESRPLWKPMHMQPVYKDADSYLDGMSERLFENGLSLPSGSALAGPQIARVFASLERFLTNVRSR